MQNTIILFIQFNNKQLFYLIIFYYEFLWHHNLKVYIYRNLLIWLYDYDPSTNCGPFTNNVLIKKL